MLFVVVDDLAETNLQELTNRKILYAPSEQDRSHADVSQVGHGQTGDANAFGGPRWLGEDGLSICDKYTTDLFGDNNQDTQALLMTVYVNTAMGGNYTLHQIHQIENSRSFSSSPTIVLFSQAVSSTIDDFESSEMKRQTLKPEPNFSSVLRLPSPTFRIVTSLW